MRKQQKRHKHDFKASAFSYATLIFCIVCFLLICEIAVFLVRLVVVS